MKKSILAIGIAAMVLTTITACGSDGTAVRLPGATTGEDVGSDGTTAGDNDGSSDEMSQECLDFAMAYASALGAMGGAGSGAEGDWSAWISGMQAAVPAALKESVAVWGAAMNDYLTVLEQHANDLTSPEVLAAWEQIDTPEVQAASDAISAYFDNGCQS